ncbi:Bug family tripartite tricarboxylate transporter substrate binding protein [Humitalea sp. 24SJ18S-53]|uniref:Bug family tripartite tricarboxylate transporter substrate binding protein n=1 Tax=Humitalea sp. 24SJ18S-53 TaxID=3422307 RepID=UPI003D67190D
MPHAFHRRAAIGAGLALPFIGTRAAIAQSLPSQLAWPSQQVRLVVPFTPGGSNDAVARPIADALQQTLGRPVMVDNRPGAGSTIGAAFVANAAPDGHTLLIASSSFVTSSTIHRTTYDAMESFEGVARVCTAPMIVVTKPRGGFPNMRALVDFARANPGRVQYGTAGLGGIGHFAMESFCLDAGIRMEVIPYAGISPSTADLIAGRIDVLITTMASVKGLVDAGTVPVIAYTGLERSPFAPDLPTIREQTGIDWAVDVWWGVLAPRGVPRAIRQRLNTEINAIVSTPAYARHLRAEGAAPAPLDLDAFASFLRTDITRWRRVAAAINLKPE